MIDLNLEGQITIQIVSFTSQIPKVGGMQNINLETLLSLHPDVVLIGSMVSQEDVDKIEKLNIPVIALIEESDITGISTLMLNLGKITAQDSAAKVEADRWQQTLENFRQDLQRPDHRLRRPTALHLPRA